MNKFTLKFTDAKIELQYRNHQIDSFQYVLSGFLSFTCLLIWIAYFLASYHSVPEWQKIQLYVAIGSVGFQTILMYKYKRLAPVSLFVLSIFWTLNELNEPGNFDYYDGVYLAQNQMLTRNIFLFTMPFRLSFVSALGHGVLRILFTDFITGPLLPSQWAYGIVMTIIQLFTLHRIEKVQRELYLMSIKDTSVQNILPLLVQKPFSLFSLNQDTGIMNEICGRLDQDFKEENAFSSLVNSASKDSVSVKDYFYQNLQDLKCYYTKQEAFVYKKAKLHVMFHYFQTKSPFYAITIENSQLDQLRIKRILHTLQIKLPTLQTQLMNPFFRMLLRQRVFRRPYLPCLLGFCQIRLLFMQKAAFETFNLGNFLRRLVGYVVGSFSYKIEYDAPRDLNIATQKYLLMCYVFEIFKNLEQNKAIQIKAVVLGETVVLSFQGLGQFSRQRLFCKLEELLFIKTLQISETFSVTLAIAQDVSFGRYEIFNNQSLQESNNNQTSLSFT